MINFRLQLTNLSSVYLVEDISVSTDIQGGPERMLQLWSLISWTSSMKQNSFFFFLFGRTFIFQQNDTMIISFKVSGL